MPSVFLSTLSLRRATIRHRIHHQFLSHFYPRSPCGERRDVIAVMTDAQSISIHALLAESDGTVVKLQFVLGGFLSTLSLRRATVQAMTEEDMIFEFLSTLSLRRATSRQPCARPTTRISIHALLAESDLFEYIQAGTGILFLSTLSLRRATAKVHKTVGHFCAYGTNFMGIASSC